MEKAQGKRYKLAYSIRATVLLPGLLSGELEKMMERHGLKLGPLIVRLALRGLLEYRRDGRLGTPQELGLPAVDVNEYATPPAGRNMPSRRQGSLSGLP
jgi:hypothetical protein